mmetsp:Transcript_21953/g.72491  ORF Transcript_21953/g.72491 Transcript_21953/m.72491 type:complete len:346 (+) Transcript_21953:227-1264(+)
MGLGVPGQLHRALLVLDVDHADIAEHLASIVRGLDQSVLLSIVGYQLLHEGISQVLSLLGLPVLEGLRHEAFDRNVRQLDVDPALSSQDNNFASNVHPSKVVTRIRLSETLVLGISNNIAELHSRLVSVEDVGESSGEDTLDLLDLITRLDKVSLKNMKNRESCSHSRLIAPLSSSLLHVHARLVAIDGTRANFLVWRDHMDSHLEPRLVHVGDRLRRSSVEDDSDGSDRLQVLSHLGIICLLSSSLSRFERVDLVDSDVIILAQHDWFAILTARNSSYGDIHVAFCKDAFSLLKLVEKLSSDKARSNNTNRNLLGSHGSRKGRILSSKPPDAPVGSEKGSLWPQ